MINRCASFCMALGIVGSTLLWGGQSGGSVVSLAPPVADSLSAVKGPDSVGTPEVAANVLRTITIRSKPDSALVVFDSMGIDSKTPATIDSVALGEHVVILKKEGYFLKKARINVSADSGNSFDFTLLKPGAVQLQSVPAGASVSFDAKNIGVTPLLKNKMKPGEYDVTFSLDGYTPLTKKVTVLDGGLDTILVTLIKAAPSAPLSSTKPPVQKATSADPFARMLVTGLFVVFGLGILLAELVGP